MPTMEEAPAWIDEEPEQQQALEEQQGEEEQEDEEEWPEDIMEGDVQSSAQPSTLIDASTPRHQWPYTIRCRAFYCQGQA